MCCLCKWHVAVAIPILRLDTKLASFTSTASDEYRARAALLRGSERRSTPSEGAARHQRRRSTAPPCVASPTFPLLLSRCRTPDPGKSRSWKAAPFGPECPDCTDPASIVVANGIISWEFRVCSRSRSRADEVGGIFRFPKMKTGIRSPKAV